MEDKSKPLDTEFSKIGGSIFLKIDPQAHNHLELEHLKKPENTNKAPGKMMMEENPEGELFISAWNPNADSQTQENNQ